MKKENNNVFQILFGKFLFGLFDLASCFSKRKNNHIRHLVGNLSDCIESRYVHLLPSDRSAGMLFFWGGKKIFFFFPFWKWVDDCYLCVVLCAGARTLQGDVVCMLTSLAWRIVRRVNGQSSPAASQCTQSLLIIRQHLVSVSFLKILFSSFLSLENYFYARRPF